MYVFTRDETWRDVQPEEVPGYLQSKDTRFLEADSNMQERQDTNAGEVRQQATQQSAVALMASQTAAFGKLTKKDLDGKSISEQKSMLGERCVFSPRCLAGSQACFASWRTRRSCPYSMTSLWKQR